MNVPPGNRPAVPRDWIRGVLEQYVAGFDTRGRAEGRSYPRSKQDIREISGLPSYYLQPLSRKPASKPGEIYSQEGKI
jgi:hypothetical protein